MIEIQPSADKPLPFDMSDEQPKTHKDGIAIAVNTSELIDKLGPGIDFADKDLHKTAELFNGTDKPATPKHISVPAEARRRHQSLLRRLTSKRLRISNRPAHSLLIS